MNHNAHSLSAGQKFSHMQTNLTDHIWGKGSTVPLMFHACAESCV